MTTTRRPRSATRAWVAATRPKQWVKNLLVFLPPAAAGTLDGATQLTDASVAFVAFCAVASGTYLLNDVADVQADRQHPVKRQRPIAAGELTLGAARAAGIGLLGAGVLVAWLQQPALAGVIVGYVVLTSTYTLWLKHEPVLDLVGVAAGFLLRAGAGAVATDVPISSWFFIVASAGAMFMVTGKRLAELRSGGSDAGHTRSTLDRYTPGYLGFVLAISASVAVLGYCLWAFEQAVALTEGGAWLELSSIPFVVGLLRYALSVDAGDGGEPEDLIWQDPVLLATGAVWATMFAVGIYAS